VMAAALGDCASLQRCSPAIFLITLALVQLRAGALIFPCPPTRGEAFSFTKLRSRKDVNDRFKIVATKLGFAALRLHDLRGTHETLLLDAVVPVQVVAARRGHDLPPSSCGAMPSERVRPTGPPLVLLGALSRGALGK
jgi:hypothetical protein